jgi:hypothetical protein
MAQLTETQRESLIFKLINAEKKFIDTFTYESKLKEQDLLEMNEVDRSIILNEIEFIKTCLIKNQLINQ